MKVISFIFSYLAITCLMSSLLSAQISESGKAKLVKAPAEMLRMTMLIEAEGKDFKAALKALAEKKKKAKIRLEKLEAIENSIKFGDASVSGGDSSAVIQQLSQRYGDDPRMQKMLQMKPPIKLSSNLVVDWTLSAEGDELLIACDELKAKITEADIGLNSEKIKLTPQQEELAAEMEEMMEQNRYYNEESQQTPGEPKFQYLRVITPEQHDKLIGKAYANAKSKAERIAAATGLNLGALESVSVGDEYEEGYGYRYQQSDSYFSTTDESGKILQSGNSPTGIDYEVDVKLQFKIKE